MGSVWQCLSEMCNDLHGWRPGYGSFCSAISHLQAEGYVTAGGCWDRQYCILRTVSLDQ